VSFEPGIARGALVTGVGSAVRVLEHPSLDVAPFTLELSLRPRVLPPPGGRAGIVDNELQYALFLLPGGHLVCTVGQQSSVTAYFVVRPDRWTAVACTYDRQRVALWIDGRMAASASAPTAPGRGGDGIALGSNNPAGDPFEGALDELRLWRVVRADEELRR
jgi:hypothetical protein